VKALDNILSIGNKTYNIPAQENVAFNTPIVAEKASIVDSTELDPLNS
jgi:hypothetical protein